MKKMADLNRVDSSTRRNFLNQAGRIFPSLFFVPSLFQLYNNQNSTNRIIVNAHLWVYASKFPPNWDCTPNIEAVFSDLSYAGIQGVELMEANLRHDNSVETLKTLVEKYNLKVSGSSYGVGRNMWNKSEHNEILEDVKLVINRLAPLNAKTFGISVGHPNRLKTEQELDDQADILQKIRNVCDDYGIEANLHNHTYEVENDMHDLKGTLARIPDYKLGPDLNWLIRGGIDPAEFIRTYGKQIVYLHIRDQYSDGVWTEYVGQGDTNFVDIAKALKEVDFKGMAAIELAFPNNFEPQFPLKEDWKKSLEFVRKTFDF